MEQEPTNQPQDNKQPQPIMNDGEYTQLQDTKSGLNIILHSNKIDVTALVDLAYTLQLKLQQDRKAEPTKSKEQTTYVG